MKTHALIVVVVAAASLLAVVGCGDSRVSAESNRIAPPTPLPTPASVGPGGELLSLVVVDVSETRSLITDHRGFAVYGHAQERPGELICVEADCTSIWIPVQPREIAVSDRLDIDRLVVIDRPDGRQQLAYGDIPLYVWSGDRDIGIAEGAGIAGVWFPLNANGEQIR